MSAVQGPDAVHEVVDDHCGAPTSLERWLAEQPRPERCAALLVSPADPLPGLAAALDAGQGVLIEHGGSARLLVPEAVGTSLRWRVHTLPSSPPPFDATYARRRVHEATEEAIGALTSLDLARERPELAETLTDLVTAGLDPRVLPSALDPRRLELLERSLRLEAICELALGDDGAAASLAQAQRRWEALRPLSAAARLGVAAATESWGRHGR